MPTWGLSRLQFPCLPPGVHCCNDKSAKMYSTQRQPYNYKFSRNLRRGPCQGKLPCTKFSGRPHDDGLATCVPSIMYRRTTRHRVVSVPFDGSAVVEGTVCPTTASSPDAVIRGTLAAGLEEAYDLLMHIIKLGKVLGCNQLATYLLLVSCEELLCFLTTNRAPFGCPAWVSALGAGLCSLSLLSPTTSSSAQPRPDIITPYVRWHENTLGFG